MSRIIAVTIALSLASHAACGEATEARLDAQDATAVSDGDVAEPPADIAPETSAEVASDAIADADGPTDADTSAPDASDTGAADGSAPDASDTSDLGDTNAADLMDASEVDSHVIDPEGDSDGDGILDLVELDDGTDPFDPRSARAWHPEIAGHPRLFAGPADQPAIAARAQASAGRAHVLWARVSALAATPMPAHPIDAGYDTDIPPTQARIAEAAALVGFALSDGAMAQKALDVLAALFPDPTPLNEQSDFNAGDHYDLLEAEALAGFCSAYDLVAGTAGVDADALAAARSRLVTRIDLFRKLCMTSGGCTTLLRGEPNNHAIKALAAIGMCAMALPDRPEAAADFAEALGAIDWLAHEKQGNLEGGWAESWNYLSYSGETHLGFLLAAHRNVALALPATGTWHVRRQGWVTRNAERNGEDIEVLDPASDSLWRAVYERALFATLPWGVTPPVDDANPSALHGGLLAALFDDARFIWNWELPGVGLHTGRQLVATFLASDPELVGVQPDWTDGFFAEAGFSVLRTTLSADASYFHVQHEQERMRLLGGSHEHANPLSFILAAHGSWLAIDPGYIDFSNHAKVKYGKDHNIVLVDGQGPEFFLDGFVDAPPNSDAFLHDHAVAPPFTSFVASTKYAGAELRRRVVRVSLAEGDVFVVADRLIAAGDHTWTFQLNGLASEGIAGTSFSTTPSDIGTLATWRRPGATLFAAVTATTGTPTTASRLEESALAARHRCLTVDALMGSAAGFLSVLVPSLPDAAPVLASERGGSVAVTTITLTGAEVRVYLNPGASPVEVVAGVGTVQVAPGVTVVVSRPGSADAVAGYTMQTPPIPDPEPFIP